MKGSPLMKLRMWPTKWKWVLSDVIVTSVSVLASHAPRLKWAVVATRETGGSMPSRLTEKSFTLVRFTSVPMSSIT